MNKQYFFHFATAYNNRENTKRENYPFQNLCLKDYRVSVGKGKCLKCQFNNGIFGKDELDKYVDCSYKKGEI